MKIDKLPIGKFDENIYVLHDHNHVLIIDPGRFADKIIEKISQEEIVDAVLLTHGHYDHTDAADDLCELYGCPLYIHTLDYALIDPMQKYPVEASVPVYTKPVFFEEGVNNIGTFQVTVYHTPGHTAGSVLIQYRDQLFTGDTLFAGTIGRTDLFSGSEYEMAESLRKIIHFDPGLKILPGHGPNSTIARELASNYYLSAVARYQNPDSFR